MSLVTTNASGNYLQLTTASPWLLRAKPFTVMCWVNPTDVTTSDLPIVLTDDGSDSGTLFWEVTTNNASGAVGWAFGWNYAPSAYRGYSAAVGGVANGLVPALVANKWQHLTARYAIDNLVNYDQWTNGIFLGRSTTLTTADKMIAGSSKKLGIGGANTATTAFPGQIAFVRIFDGILTGQEIRMSMNSRTVPPILRARLILDMPLEQMEGTTPYAFDLSQYQQGGTTAHGTTGWGEQPPISTLTIPNLQERVWLLTGVPASTPPVAKALKIGQSINSGNIF